MIEPTAQKPDRRSARTRELIEQAALQAFSARGYDGASTRYIADLAGVKQQLITYHYENKLGLWKAAADRLFGACKARFENRLVGLEGVDEITKSRLLVREFLEFSSQHPELARFMSQEGAVSSERLNWLYEQHTKELLGFAAATLDRARQAIGAPAADPKHLTYVLAGASAMFSVGAEYQLLTGRDVDDPEVVEAYTNLVVSLLLPG